MWRRDGDFQSTRGKRAAGSTITATRRVHGSTPGANLLLVGAHVIRSTGQEDICPSEQVRPSAVLSRHGFLAPRHFGERDGPRGQERTLGDRRKVRTFGGLRRKSAPRLHRLKHLASDAVLDALARCVSRWRGGYVRRRTNLPSRSVITSYIVDRNSSGADD
jgi:hypothetical protein